MSVAVSYIEPQNGGFRIPLSFKLIVHIKYVSTSVYMKILSCISEMHFFLNLRLLVYI